MKITLKGLRTALDKVCLYLLPLMVFGIPIVMLASTDKNGGWYQANMVSFIVANAIVTGAVGAAYVVLAVIFWIIMPEDKNAPLPYNAEEWARAHSVEERKASLKRDFFIVGGVVFASLLLMIITVRNLQPNDSGSGVVFLVSFALMIGAAELISRNTARETAHKRLMKAEKAKA